MKEPFKNIEGYEFAGRCVIDGRRVYRELDGSDPDPRGELGITRSAYSLVASEYGMAGDDVLLCYACAQESDRNAQGVEYGKRIWKEQA